MKRNKHSLSHYVLSTFDMGQLIPVANFDVLPGDSVRMSTSCLLRVSPLMTPVMHPVTVRLHHWFVPYRILYPDWEDFITGGPDGTGAATPPPTAFGTTPAKGLMDYLGLPPAVTLPTISLFPVMAYNLIWNEFYRDQDLQTEVDLDGSGEILPIAWEKDYFTAARPWTQKGPDVTVPVDGPVTTAASPVVTGARTPIDYSDAATGTPISATGNLGTNASGAGTWTSGANTGAAVYPNNLEVVGASASINDFRLAFALQRYQEARAQYGSRYTEYLRYLGVRSSDARLQRPEYLGGGKSTISFSEVLRTGDDPAAPDPAAPIGEMRGHGISAMRSRRFIRFFEEHGTVLTLCSVRPRSMYMDGVHRKFSRTTKEDYWQKELELVGQQPIFNKELFAAGASPNGVWGYQDRYAEYRHHPSYVTSEFRDVLNDWHLARSFASQPVLNDTFVECVPSKRIHAEQTQNTLWGMFSHSIQARRMVGKRTIGRIM